VWGRRAPRGAARPSAVHPVPPPLAVPARAPDYLAGSDERPDSGDRPDPSGRPDPGDRPGLDRAAGRAVDGAAPPAGAGTSPAPGASPAPGPAPGRPRHELEPLLDSRTKGKARTAPLALFVLAALVVIIYLATTH
jgi:hypothetical protein